MSSKRVKKTLEDMYEYHKTYFPSNTEESSQPLEMGTTGFGIEADAFQLYASRKRKHLKEVHTMENKSEVEKYLQEALVDMDDEKFDLLSWWNVHSSRFKILSLIARDVLAIPVSTVASESAFSTGGRTISPYRSSLSSKTVQSLICTQNWIRSSPIINIQESLDEIEAL